MTAAAENPAKTRLTTSNGNDGARLVNAFPKVKQRSPIKITFRFPSLSDSPPSHGATIAYMIEKAATIHPAAPGVIENRLEMDGKRGDTTNKSVPMMNNVSHPATILKR